MERGTEKGGGDVGLCCGPTCQRLPAGGEGRRGQREMRRVLSRSVYVEKFVVSYSLLRSYCEL